MVGCWTCNPEVPGSNPPPCHEMDLSLVAPNSTLPGCVIANWSDSHQLGFLTYVSAQLLFFV